MYLHRLANIPEVSIGNYQLELVGTIARLDLLDPIEHIEQSMMQHFLAIVVRLDYQHQFDELVPIINIKAYLSL